MDWEADWLRRVLPGTGVSIWSPVFDIMDFFRPATDAITARRKGDYKESVGWDKRACSERPWDQGKVWRSVASTTEFQSMAVALLFVSVLHRHQYFIYNSSLLGISSTSASNWFPLHRILTNATS